MYRKEAMQLPVIGADAADDDDEQDLIGHGAR